MEATEDTSSNFLWTADFLRSAAVLSLIRLPAAVHPGFSTAESKVIAQGRASLYPETAHEHHLPAKERRDWTRSGSSLIPRDDGSGEILEQDPVSGRNGPG